MNGLAGAVGMVIMVMALSILSLVFLHFYLVTLHRIYFLSPPNREPSRHQTNLIELQLYILHSTGMVSHKSR